MKIKYLSGPRTGQIEHVQNSIGNLAVGAGLATEVPRDPSVSLIDENRANLRAEIGAPQIPPPIFSVKEKKAADSANSEGSILVIELKLGDAVSFFTGDPERANARKEWPVPGGGTSGRYLNGLGREIPAAILKEYKKRWKNNPELRGANFAVRAEVPGDPNMHTAARTFFIE
jgi:hypothetical protein